jgi:hypothetical protein
MKRILDPSFRYKPSFATDLRRTFARIRSGRARTREGMESPTATNNVEKEQPLLTLVK